MELTTLLASLLPLVGLTTANINITDKLLDLALFLVKKEADTDH
jgi:hypothetical protein